MRFDVYVRINRQKPLLHDLDLRPANSRHSRPKLAVYIRRVVYVAVDENQAADAGPAKSLSRKGTDAADAEHQHCFAR